MSGDDTEAVQAARQAQRQTLSAMADVPELRDLSARAVVNLIDLVLNAYAPVITRRAERDFGRDVAAILDRLADDLAGDTGPAGTAAMRAAADVVRTCGEKGIKAEARAGGGPRPGQTARVKTMLNINEEPK